MKIKKPEKECSRCVHDKRHSIYGVSWSHCLLCSNDKEHWFSCKPYIECVRTGHSSFVWDGSTK